MKTTSTNLLNELTELRQRTNAATSQFYEENQTLLDEYRKEIFEGMPEALALVRETVADLSLENDVCVTLAEQMSTYIDWFQWSLWDLPFFAVALKPTKEKFRRSVMASAFVYLSIRLFDDVIDRHFWYKGRRPTLLAATAETAPNSKGVEGLSVIAGLLLCYEGLLKIADSDDPEFFRSMKPMLNAARNVVIGLMMELGDPGNWDRDYYDRMAELKNVDYWHILYSSLDPDYSSSLYAFLRQYYILAQHLNDLEDFVDDLMRGQPNLLAYYLPQGTTGIAKLNGDTSNNSDAESGDGAAPKLNGHRNGVGAIRVDNAGVDIDVKGARAEAESFLAAEFIELGQQAEALSPVERQIALLKLGESLEAAHTHGVFGSLDTLVKPEPAAKPYTNIDLHWYSTLDEVVEQAGADALEMANCGVCGSTLRSYLFQKHGFTYHRCIDCSHIYTSPRINNELQIQIGHDLDEEDVEGDVYLHVQKLYAASLCNLLAQRAPGKRLLDIGFGSGYLAELAQAYGFEVFGVDSSPGKVEQLWPRFGPRLQQIIMGRDDIPWQSFDVIIMSHVIEHLPNPAATISEVRRLLNPHGLLYVAVPDMESLPFKIFGKKWDVVNPIVHYQYFTKNSLRYLLKNSGFASFEQVEHPQTPLGLMSEWSRFMHELEGSESSELSVLAQADS